MMKLLLSLMVSGPLLAASFDAQAWTHRRLLKVNDRGFSGWRVDAELYRSSAAGLRDLRVVRGGREVPYLVKSYNGSLEQMNVETAMMDKAVIPRVGLQFILDLSGASTHNQILISTERFDLQPVIRIETSDDRRVWGAVKAVDRSYYSSEGERRFGNHTITYPDSTRRYVRVTLVDWTNPDWVRSVQARFVRQQAAQREVIGTFRPTVTEKAESKETELVFDLGFARPHDRIDFVVSPAILFSRAAFVSVSSDGKQWGSEGSATLERTAKRESLSAQLPESWERYVRVTISNYDNAPLPVTMAVFHAVRRELIFSAPEAGDYWLYAGNANAAAASYDLGSILPAEASLLPVSAGAVQANPDYVAPQKPWTERSSLPLTILLIILVPLVGTVAFRMLRRVEAQP